MSEQAFSASPAGPTQENDGLTFSASPAFSAVPTYLQRARERVLPTHIEEEKEEKGLSLSQGEYLSSTGAHAEKAGNAEKGLTDFIASQLAPAVRFTVRETSDGPADRAFVGQLRAVIDEHPGANHVVMRCVLLNGATVAVRWRALASRQLRLALGRLLAERMVPG